MPTSPTMAGPVSIPIRVRPSPIAAGGGAATKALGPGPNGNRAFDGTLWMILKVEWGIEKSMHAVSDELIDHTTVLDHDSGNALEILVQRCDQLLGADAMRRRGEALDVSEQGSDLAPLAIELYQVRLFNDASDDRRGEMLFEPMAHERFPPARQPVGGAGCQREHQHGGNVGA
ncbi:hypothetical protein AC629_33010 [Bradyrhizobium sp. NAS80.1]|nr:hypothetical protein AC629_33010 [Bradyrhizobium sp. NAS80.1]